MGVCGSECRTIARACSDLVEELDYELTEALFKGKEERAALTQRFCREASSVCSKKPPKLPRDRPQGPPFIPMTEEDYKMAKMMQQMKEMGLGGRVFDQDSAQRYIAEHSGQLSDDEEDVEDEREGEGVEKPKDRSAGFNFMETVDWAKEEAGKKLASGYASAQNIYHRVRERFKKNKSEL